MRVAVLTLLCFTTCYGQPKPADANLTPPPEQRDERVRNGLTEKMGNFSVEFLYHVSAQQGPGQNLIISPITIWTALAVIAEGASGNTKREINVALRLTRNYNITRMNFGQIARWLLVKTNTVDLAKFNGIFVDNDKLLDTDYRENAKTYYDTDVVSLNFKNPEVSASLLNKVISNFTHGRIPSIVEASNLQDTPMVLASALYFKGQWTIPFNTSSTSKQPFFNSNGTQIGEVNMMYNRATFPFANMKMLQARVIELPYGKENRLSMIIMLPNHGVSLENMFSNFQKVPLDTFFEEIRLSREEFADDEVDCFIPRFKIKSDLDLTDILKQKMNIKDLFDSKLARLPLMARTPIYASKIVHKAEIEVTEEGTVATAVTVAEFSNRIGIVRFEANRPFTYMIVEKKTNSIVFGGFYKQPSLY